MSKTRTKTITSRAEVEDAVMWGAEYSVAALDKGFPAYITMSVEPPDLARDDKENRKFHAIMQDMWKQGVFGETKLREAMTFKICKSFLVKWFVEDCQEQGMVFPKYMHMTTAVCPRTGDIISDRPSTTEFSQKWSKEFCQWLWSTGIQDLTVKFTEPAHREYEQYREANNE